MPTDPLRQELEALPPPPLSPELWPRLAMRRKRQLTVRRAGIALAIATLAFGPLALLRQAQDAPPRTPSNAAGAPAANVAPGAVSNVAPGAVSAIDQALQNAYARGASDDEIAPLWEVRRRLAGTSHASTPINPS